MERTISVVGLGKLGAPLAACLAEKGMRVIGVDADPRKVEAINHGLAPVYEPQLEEFIGRSNGRLTATHNIAEAVAASEITFIVVATPSEPDGSFSLRYVLPVCKEIGQALHAKPEFHVVVLTSTVMPGITGGPVRSALEEASGKVAGRDFGLCYGPEFIALGSVIRDFLNPDFVLIGESDSRSGATLEAIYKEVCEKAPRAARMNFVNAEIAKLSVNTFVTTKISFANMVARICELLPGADVDVVTAAMGLDTRIGTKYLKGAISYGGPCFPRDNQALSALAREIGAPADLAEATDRFNRSQVQWLADLVQRHSTPHGLAGILGVTYKPDSDVMEEAPGLLLAKELARRGVSVVAYDPTCHPKRMNAFDGGIRWAQTPEECVEQSEVVVLTTPWRECCSVHAKQWARHSPPRTVIDCWRVLPYLEHEDGVRYLSLGTGSLLTASRPSARIEVLTQSKERPTLTLFALPKAFKGHFSAIQRNAISQWARLRPRPEILLFGNEEGTAEIAREFGLRHIAEVKRNKYGTPLLSDLFEKAQHLASCNTLCYVNADIMLLGDFMKAVQQVVSWSERFLMVGRRKDVDLDEPAIYESPDQENRLQVLVLQQNLWVSSRSIDYFVFSKGLYRTIPPFALGRLWWDNWLLWKARRSNAAIVDASEVVLAVHQNHDYSHHAHGRQGVYQGNECQQNRKLAGRGFCTMEDVGYKLTSNRIEYNLWHVFTPMKRVVRPWWWALLKITGPVRHPLGLRQEKIASFMAKIKLLSSQ